MRQLSQISERIWLSSMVASRPVLEEGETRRCPLLWLPCGIHRLSWTA